MIQDSLQHRRSGVGRSLALLRVATCLTPLLSGCAAFPTLTTSTSRPDTDVRGNPDVVLGSNQSPGTRQPEVLAIPGAAPVAANTQVPATQAQIEALVSDEQVDATLAPQSVPQFAATVFGGLLGVPYTLAPDVAQRTEMIAGGTGGTLSKRDLFRLTQEALRQYGVEVYVTNGFVTVGNVNASDTNAALNRGREVSGGAGRVVQFFNVQTIEVGALQPLLADVYPNLGGARITPDPLSNTLIISGPAGQVANVVRVLRELDQPRFAGAEVLRVEPIYLSTDDLASALERVLTTEGYVISREPLAGRAITLLSFPAANQILVFAQDPVLLQRVRYWVDTLDQPSALGSNVNTFVYTAQNTDAQSLGQLAMGQTPTVQTAQPPVGVPGTPAVDASQGNTGARTLDASRTSQTGAQGTFLTGRILTDPIGNRILFTGTATEYAQLRTLLTTLDTPAPQVVIEVMIAEVTLTDATELGFQAFGAEQRGDGLLSGGTEGIALGGGAFSVVFSGPEFRARFAAEASNNRVNILQRPQLVARSGGTARFQVGTDVPIITSQRATDFQSDDGVSDILQSVQYRQTGVILEIRPIVYGDRVDIAISQEISAAGQPPNAAIASPSILNRSLTTQIAINDGWTGVLGGLISNNYETVNVGIPFLKDLPVIGSAFQNNSVDGTRTELLVLITPRIIRGAEDMADLADRYSADMNAAFKTGRGWSYTLTPLSLTPAFRGIGLNLPTAGRESETPRLFPRPAAAPPAQEPAPAE